VTMQEHPSDVELLELVEGDLDEPERAAIETHIATCARCAAAVAELEQAREVLRSAPLLELPPERRALIFESLPPQEADRSGVRRFFSSPRRIALVAVPVAAAAIAAAVTISLTGGGGGAESKGERLQAEASRTAAPPAAEAGGTAATTAAAIPAPAPSIEAAPAKTGATETSAAPQPTTIRALGAATDVADELERAGIHVDRVLAHKVIVTGDPAAVRAALDGRLSSPEQPGVDVVVQPPTP